MYETEAPVEQSSNYRGESQTADGHKCVGDHPRAILAMCSSVYSDTTGMCTCLRQQELLDERESGCKSTQEIDDKQETTGMRDL